MRFLLTLMFFIPIFSFSQTGVISGNAFWKYNDYVGDKADAGSKVLFFSENNLVEAQQSTCDLQGNFRFDNIKPGKYLIAIISQNTRTLIKDNLNHLKETYTEPYIGFSILTSNKPLYDSLDFYAAMVTKANSSYDSLTQVQSKVHSSNISKMTMWNAKKTIAAFEKQESEFTKQRKEYEEIKQKQINVYENAIERLIELIPYSINTEYLKMAFKYKNKLYMKEVEVKPNQTEVVVVNFGLTAF